MLGMLLLDESKGGEQSYQLAKHSLECQFLYMSQLLVIKSKTFLMVSTPWSKYAIFKLH